MTCTVSRSTHCAGAVRGRDDVGAGGTPLLCGTGLIITVSQDMNRVMDVAEQFYGPEMWGQLKAAGMNADQLRLSGYFWGGIGTITAVLFGGLGIFVLRGRMWAIITGIVIASLLTLLNLCSTISGLVAVRLVPAGLAGGCLYACAADRLWCAALFPGPGRPGGVSLAADASAHAVSVLAINAAIRGNARIRLWLRDAPAGRTTHSATTIGTDPAPARG